MIQPSDLVLPLPGLVSRGVDWITGTAKAGYSPESWDAVCGSLLCGDHQEGNFARVWSMLGYDGFKCGSVFCGERHDGALVQVSGEAAATLWPIVADFCGNFPRIDLQATLRIDSDPYSYVRRVDQRMRKAKRRMGRGPTIAFQRSEDGGATAYVGRKTSKRYGRCYNKHAQSKDDFFQNCVRWEAVFREDIGRQVVGHLWRSPDRDAGVGACLLAYFSEVGADPPQLLASALHLKPAALIHSPARMTDARRKLLWLATQVAPTVKLLCDNGYSREVQEALGVLDHVKSDFER
jgi:hypothetical protein